MNQEQIQQAINNGLINGIPTSRSTANLIANNRYFPGIYLYKKEYQGVNTYIAVFDADIKRTGLNALVNLDNEWYIIPVVLDVTLLKSLMPLYRKCTLLSGFAENDTEANKLVTVAKSLSTPLQFEGQVVKTPNRPTKRFTNSFTIKLNKNLPYKLDLDEVISTLADINWDE